MKKKFFTIFLIVIIPVWILVHQKYSHTKSKSKGESSITKRVYFNIDTLVKRVKEDQKDGNSLMIGDENISEFIAKTEAEGRMWNVTTLTNQELKGKKHLLSYTYLSFKNPTHENEENSYLFVLINQLQHLF